MIGRIEAPSVRSARTLRNRFDGSCQLETLHFTGSGHSRQAALGDEDGSFGGKNGGNGYGFVRGLYDTLNREKDDKPLGEVSIKILIQFHLMVNMI